MTFHPVSLRLAAGRAHGASLGNVLAIALVLGGLCASTRPVAASTAPLARHRVQVTPGRFLDVRGERNHQQRIVRRLPATWSADQKTSAATYGFPVFRLRELSAGVLTELWTYPEADVQLVFDAAGRLRTTRLP